MEKKEKKKVLAVADVDCTQHDDSFLTVDRTDSGLERFRYILNLASEDGPFQSPINLNVSEMQQLELGKLTWYNYGLQPKKMKLTNSGHTVILSGKWYGVRPFIRNGPLNGSYVFSQLHFHWGESDDLGSEHTVDNNRFPMEMHAVHFKSSYLTQEAALRQQDGLAIIVFLFKLQSRANPQIQQVVRYLQDIPAAHTSIAKFRTLCDVYEQPITHNYRAIQPLNNRSIFHISPRQ